MNEKRNGLFSWFGSLIIFIMVLPTPVFSQALTKKVTELEQRIAQLEKRIVKLEGIILEFQKNQEKPISSSPTKWKNKANWRLIRKGMNKDEVRQILGEAPKVVANVHYGDIWYYPDTQGGNTSFDKEGILTSWREIE